jgi:hypothetical protein
MSNPNDFIEMKSSTGVPTSHSNADIAQLSVSPVDPSPLSSYAVISPPAAALAPSAALSLPPPPQPPPQLSFTPSLNTPLPRPTPALMYGDQARNERRISGLEKELIEQKSTMSRVEDLLVRLSGRLDSNVTGNISIDTTQVQPPSPAVPAPVDSSHMNHSAGRTPYVRDSLPAVHENDVSHLYDDGHIPSSASETSFVSHRSTGSSLRGVKVEAPPVFDGKPGSTAVSLTTWINQMEIWLEVIDVGVSAPKSLPVSLTRLSGMALSWYINVKRREEREISLHSRTNFTIHNWLTLREALRERYVPQQQEQISTNRLLSTRYTGSVEIYNSKFMNELMLVPDLCNPATESFVMTLYARGIQGPGTDYYATLIQQARSKGEVKTIYELMNYVQMAEQNLRLATENSRGRPRDAGPILTTAGNFGANRVRFGNNFPGRFRENGSPATPGNLFQTPAKLNHLAGSYDQDDEINSGDSVADSQEDEALHHMGSTGDVGDDSSTDPDGTGHSDVDTGFLNALRIYDQLRKENPSLSPEEMERRRRSGTCFRCNKPGHYANKCSLAGPPAAPFGVNKKFQQKNQQ